MKLYTFVVRYLQMCMKEYGCCPKFKRGGNSTYTFTKFEHHRIASGGVGDHSVRSLTVLVIIEAVLFSYLNYLQYLKIK